ncbi:hypothetical protein [Pseudomonas asiatica]|uniref:hypothetical protein n=1 Tax=Pseudomonas asiatica TaxID=2219225 RepID=UPI001AAF9CD1|nr:hypothetical protein [Pseudomonas asiatica]MBO2889550.1 hypothetical protein [Pseudomonas asiatica]
MDTNKMRAEFESAFVAEQMAKFGEGFRDSALHLLKRDGVFLTTPSLYELSRREQGMYDSYWVEMVWWAWQASRAAVVVELPKDIVTMAGPVLYADDVRAAIEAQGLKVEVKP